MDRRGKEKDLALCHFCAYKKVCAQLNDILDLQDRLKEAISSGNFGHFRDLNEEITRKMAQVESLPHSTPYTTTTAPAIGSATSDAGKTKDCLESSLKNIHSKNQELEILVRDYMSSVSREIESIRQVRWAGQRYRLHLRKQTFFDSAF